MYPGSGCTYMQWEVHVITLDFRIHWETSHWNEKVFYVQSSLRSSTIVFMLVAIWNFMG